jgi:Ca2+-binding EF-hand superfamily protein
MTTSHPTFLKLAALSLLAFAPFQVAAQNGAGATLDRATRMLHQKFIAADIDKDGLLTKEEAEKGNMPTTAKYFDEIDTSHRGKVSENDIKRFFAQSAAERSKTP